MKPIIGIVARSTKDVDDYSILYTNNFLIQAIIKCGGIPLIILPTQGIDYEENTPSKSIKMNDENRLDLNKIMNLCDGIVLPGGSKWYEYDEYICRYALDNNIPLLGICAGMQLMAKVLNNEVINGVDNTIKNNDSNHNVKGKYAHKITLLKDSKLYEIIGIEQIDVNSKHNYHIRNIFSFMASAFSSDGIIEAIEYRDNEFALGIQWHPETMIDYDNNAKKLIKTFISVAKNKSF